MNFKHLFGIFCILLCLSPMAFADDLMVLHGKAYDGNKLMALGDVRVQIYNAQSGGAMIYDSGLDFNGAIINGLFDVLLGSGVSLDLNLGQRYYYAMQINAMDINFGTSLRQVFQSAHGDLNIYPISQLRNDSGYITSAALTPYLTKVDANGFYAFKTDVNLWTNQLLVPYLTKTDANGFYALKSDVNIWTQQLLVPYATGADTNVWIVQKLVPYLLQVDANGFFAYKTDVNLWTNQLLVPYLLKTDANGFYAFKNDVNVWIDQKLVPYLTKIDANGFYPLKTDVNTWTNQLLVPYLLKLDANGFYAYKSDVNLWGDQRYMPINTIIPLDTNWQTSWTTFDANMRYYFALKSDVNIWITQNLAPYLLQVDANGFYTLKSDTNVWIDQRIAPYLLKTDANGFYALKNDVNIWIDQKIAGFSGDTNWQTSWNVFDANMKATYATLGDVNLWGDQRYLPLNTVLMIDTNTETVGWTDNLGNWLQDLDVNGVLTAHNLVAGDPTGFVATNYLLWLHNFTGKTIAGIYSADDDSLIDLVANQDESGSPNSQAAIRFANNGVWTGAIGTYDNNSGVKFIISMPNGSGPDLSMNQAITIDINLIVTMFNDLNVNGDIYQNGYLVCDVSGANCPPGVTDTNWQTSWTIFDANMKANYTQLNDTNIWIDNKLVPYLTKVDANGFYTLKSDTNIWIDQKLAPYILGSDANMFYAFKTDVNLWGDQRYLPLNTVLMTDTNWQTSWNVFDANMKATYTQLGDTNIWIAQYLVPYLLGSDANGFYAFKTDVNLWGDQRYLPLNTVFTDTNWQTSWATFDANMKANYTQIGDTNIWIDQKLVPYLTKIDANGFYPLKEDVNTWGDQRYLPVTTVLPQTKAFVAKKFITDYNAVTGYFNSYAISFTDINSGFPAACPSGSYIYQLAPGVAYCSYPTDTNWQTSFGLFDANMKATYTQLNDTNIWIDNKLVPYLLKTDANGFYALKDDVNIWIDQKIAALPGYTDTNWETSWDVFDANMKATYTKIGDTNVWIAQYLMPYLLASDANGFFTLKSDTNVWIDQKLIPYLTKVDANGFYPLKTDINVWIDQRIAAIPGFIDTNWETSFGVFDANMRATYATLGDVNLWGGQLYAFKGDVNTWTNQLLVPYLTKLDANGFYALKTDVNIWTNQLLVPYLTKADANGFYALKNDVNTWIGQLAVPYTGADRDVNLGSHGISYYDVNWTGGRVTNVPLDANIQVFIDNATAGDTLLLGSGTYTITSAIRVDKTLNIRGQGNAKIYNATADVNIFYITADNAKLTDVNIFDVGAGTKAVFINGANNVTLRNITMNTTGAGYEYGVYSLNGSGAILGGFITINSTDQNAYAINILNNSSTTQDQNWLIEGALIYANGVVRAKGVIINNQNSSYYITANIVNSQINAKSTSAFSTYGLETTSISTANARAYVYGSTIGGELTDINAVRLNTIYLYATTLLNGTIGGDVHYLGTATANTIYFDTNGEPGNYQEGKMFYDPTWKTVSVQIGRDVTMQIGQEEFRRVYNNTGAIVRNGQAVITNGVYNGFPTIALAQANTESTAQVLGLATQDIPINDYGFITVRGNINDLNTNIASWTEGDLLYLSATTPGEVTNIVPDAPNYEMRIGRLIIKDATGGRINVRIIPYTNLSNLGDVTITSPTVSQVLTYNGVSWVNSAASNTSASNGIAFYLDGNDINANTPQNAFALEQLFKVPVTTTPQNAEALSATITRAPIGSAYLYNTDLNRTVLDGGTWTFYTYGAVSSTGGGRISSLFNVLYKVRNYVQTDTNVTMAGAGVTRYVIATANAPFSTALIDTNFTANDQNLYAGYLQTPKGLYKVVGRTSDTNITISVPSGYVNETAVKFSTWKRLFFAQTPTITAIAPNYTLYISTASSGAIDMNSTDRIGLVMVGVSNNTTTITYVYNGTANQSYFNSPLITLHNNLAGLQGGAANEYYHLAQTDFITATQAATNLQNGYLTSGDWVTFNAKASISDLNEYTLLSDTNVWTNQLIRQAQVDSNKWSLTKVDANGFYALKDDVNSWIDDKLTPYLTQVDANGFYYNKEDVNASFLTKVDANGFYALKDDVNTWIDQKIAGLTYDTNWQTSWDVFDANMKYYFAQNADVNNWIDQKIIALSFTDTNWETSWDVFDANMKANYTQLNDTNIWIDQKIAGLGPSMTDTNWETSFGIFDSNMRATYVTLGDVNLWTNQLLVPYLTKIDANGFYALKNDVNVWVDQKLVGYLTQVDANGFYPLKEDVNIWIDQKLTPYLTKIDANGFYTIKADTNIWIDQKLLPYLTQVDANGFYPLKSDVNIWGDQRYLKLTGGTVTGSIVATQDINAANLHADTNITIGINGYIYDDGTAIVIGRR